MRQRSDSVDTEVLVIAGQIAETLGLALYDVTLQRSGPRWKLQVLLSGPDGRGASLSDCERLSRQLSRELDVLDPIPAAYDLEVSSPGLERPLRRAEHWRGAVGEKIKLRWREATGSTQTQLVVLDAFEEDTATVRDEKNQIHRVCLSDVVSARLHVDWQRELERR